MAGCWGYIGEGGALVPIKGAQAGLSVSPARPGEDFTTVAGTRYAMEAYRSNRSWSIALSPWSDPSLVSVLRMAAAGVLRYGLLGGPSLYTADSAAVNLLPDYIADPSSPVGEWGAASGTINAPIDYGVSMTLPAYGSIGSVVWSRYIPILPGTLYTLSAITAGAGTLYSVEVRNAAMSSVLTTALTSPASAGSARALSVSFTTPSDGAWLRIARGATMPTSTGPRLVEGSDADYWYWQPGQGIPLVQVLDPQYVIQSTAGGKVRADFTVTLQEVGL